MALINRVVVRDREARAFCRAYLAWQDADRPLKKRTALSELDGMAKLQSEVDGEFTATAYRLAVQDGFVAAGPRPAAPIATSAQATRDEYAAWLEEYRRQVATRLEMIGRGEMPTG